MPRRKSTRRASICPVAVSACLVLCVGPSACVSTKLVHLERLEVAPAHSASSGGPWRHEMAAVLDAYEASPVMVPEDERLGPLYGGLTTLSYFGADSQSRVLDQQLAPPAPARGGTLASACSAPTDDRSEVALAMSGVPAFVPVWVPLSAKAEAVPESARCDERGRASGGGAGEVFCAFARVALQPDSGGALIVVAHGLFDSGAQDYVQHMAAELYRLGHSVLLPDLRDHGDTWRAAPWLATTFGTLESRDLLALVAAARRDCAARIGRAGIAGVSGGGLAAIRAFALDGSNSLDAGVIAVSPLLDVPGAIGDLSQTGRCLATRSIELSLTDTMLLAGATGAAFFGGAVAVQALSDRPLDGTTALAAAIGVGIGLSAGLMADAWLDGGSEPCVSEHAIANMVEAALRVRWRALQTYGVQPSMSPAGMHRDPDTVTIETYVRERAQPLAARLGVTQLAADPRDLARELRDALSSEPRASSRLLVIGAADDPVTRVSALRDFIGHMRELPQVYAREVRHGGHGAFWIVQPTITAHLLARFFEARPGPKDARPGWSTVPSASPNTGVHGVGLGVLRGPGDDPQLLEGPGFLDHAIDTAVRRAGQRARFEDAGTRRGGELRPRPLSVAPVIGLQQARGTATGAEHIVICKGFSAGIDPGASQRLTVGIVELEDQSRAFGRPIRLRLCRVERFDRRQNRGDVPRHVGRRSGALELERARPKLKVGSGNLFADTAGVQQHSGGEQETVQWTSAVSWHG
jgi:predicted alpha/beta-fold hydrolase